MTMELSHINSKGEPSIVDVSAKQVTRRTASAQAVVTLPAKIFSLLHQESFATKKGPVIQTAIIAGIMGAKKTGELIPLCHPLGLENCTVDIEIRNPGELTIYCTASIEAKTGVEMEALTGVSVAALTIYDMCKALSHDIVIKEVKLMEKTGGKNDFKRG